jgi:hypothetical protein
MSNSSNGGHSPLIGPWLSGFFLGNAFTGLLQLLGLGPPHWIFVLGIFVLGVFLAGTLVKSLLEDAEKRNGGR